MRQNKKQPAGCDERIQQLQPIFGVYLQEALAQQRSLKSGKDDVLDAFAALWTAARIVTGNALTLPFNPPKDRCGLRMEIVA